MRTFTVMTLVVFGFHSFALRAQVGGSGDATPPTTALPGPPSFILLPATVTVFGPRDFVRGSEVPQEESRSFTALLPKYTYTMRVFNGGDRRQYPPVASAEISLNGVYVIGTKHFRRNVPLIEQSVTVAAENSFSVELRGEPGSGITLEISAEISAASCTPPAVIPGHASLCVGKDINDYPLMAWSGVGPFNIFASTAANFSPEAAVDTLSIALSGQYPDVSILYTNNGARFHFDAAASGAGEASAPATYLGYEPPPLPAITSASDRRICKVGALTASCAYVGDTVTLTGSGFDPISLNNQIYYNAIKADVQPAGGTPTQFNITVPKSAVSARLSVCTFGKCATNQALSDVLVVGPDKSPGGAWSISGTAFDDGRDGSPTGHNLWFADWNSHKIYSVGTETPGGATPQAMIPNPFQPVIPSVTYRDGAIPYMDQANPDQIGLLDRVGVSSVFASSHDIGPPRCGTVPESAQPKPWALAINSADASNVPGTPVFICDGNGTGQIRRVPAGTLAADTGKIIPTLSGFSFSPYGMIDFCPLIYFPGLDVQTIKRGPSGFTDVRWSVGDSASCNTYYSQGNVGFYNAHSFTLNELRDYGWYKSYSYLRNFTFAQDATTHFGFTANAVSGYIYRDLDPEIYFTPVLPRVKVIISNEPTGGSPYPIPCSTPGESLCQEQDAEFRLTVNTLNRPGLRVYLRVIDPRDTSGFNVLDTMSNTYKIGRCSPFAGSKTCTEDPVGTGQACDNRGWCDPADNIGIEIPSGTNLCPGFSLPSPGSYLMATCVITNPSNDGGKADIILHTTKRYAGDNYKIQAGLENFISGTINYTANAHIKAESPTFEVWKRIFVEKDNMFKEGALMWAAAGSPEGVIPAGSTVIRVFNGSSGGQIHNINKYDQIVLFDTFYPAEARFDIAYAGQPDNPGGSFSNIPLFTDKTLTTSYSTKVDYVASRRLAASNNPDFSFGRSAGIGSYENCQPYRLGPDSCFFNNDTSAVRDTFGDAYTEFIFPTDGQNTLPYLALPIFDNLTDDSYSSLSQQWFKHFVNSGTGLPPQDTPHNYFHLLGITERSPIGPGEYRIGYTLANYDWTFDYIKTIESFPGTPQQIARVNQDDVNHEFGHQFRANACTADGHDTRNAWCEIFGHCSLMIAIAEQCTLNGNSFEQKADGVSRFDENDLYFGDPTCPAPPAGQPPQGAIRTDIDPE